MADTTSDRYLAISALRSWAKLVVSGLTDALCLREPYAGPRPDAAYLSVAWVSGVGTGLPYAARGISGSDPTDTPRHPKLATLAFRAWGEDAQPWLDVIDRSRARPDVQALLAAAGFGVVGTTPTDLGDIVRDGVRYELGSALEVVLSYQSVDSSPIVGVPLEVVGVDMTFSPGDLDVNITVDTTP